MPLIETIKDLTKKKTNKNEMNWLKKLSQKNLPNKLYHGSRQKFPIGFILQPQAEGYVHEELETEQIIEQYRPSNKISRFDSVFLVDDPSNIDYAGGYDDYIYVVEPIGQVDKSNLSWYTDVSVYLDASHEEQKEWSLNYWNGIPYEKRANSLWEYRTKAAEIIDIIDKF